MKINDVNFKYVNRAHRKVSYEMYKHNYEVQLIVGKETFNAHRDILTDASD